MSLPRFFPRVVDALHCVLPKAERNVLASQLGEVAVRLSIPDAALAVPGQWPGIMVTADLLARLYPAVEIAASPEVADQLSARVLAINPRCDVSAAGNADVTVSWGRNEAVAATIPVAAAGWTILMGEAVERMAPSSPLAAMAAACYAADAVLRVALGDSTTTPAPIPRAWAWSLLDENVGDVDLLLDEQIEIGECCLVGCGAIGHAFGSALSTLRATGLLVVVDPEDVEESNLQRYVGTVDSDEGAAKVDTVGRLVGASGIDVKCVKDPWETVGLVERVRPVFVGVDSAVVRLRIQASLPPATYNAFTDLRELGWSRHERFGVDPCMACVYWPSQPAQNRHDLIGNALQQPSGRILLYLVKSTPIGQPLPQDALQGLPSGISVADATPWTQTSLADDLARTVGDAIDMFRERSVDDLYREGVCGGRLMAPSEAMPEERVVVPLAHQSALAGIMLATELVCRSHPRLLSARRQSQEWRIPSESGLGNPYTFERARTPQCICADAHFVAHYRSLWPDGGR